MVMWAVTAGSNRAKQIARLEDLRDLSVPVRELQISGDQLSEQLHVLSAWSEGLTGLLTLKMSSSGLMRLPDSHILSLGALAGLQTLDLQGCSGLKGLPEWLGGLTGLQTLDLSEWSGLKGLPESLGGLTGLQTREV